MRLNNGKWECLQCRAEVEIPAGKTPQNVTHAESGKPNERVLVVDGVEVHRCVIEMRRRRN
jgi:hypothetical protein